jgi:phenylacetate-coenzyme A ligase PaaK-like adenylate-forming protein
MGPVEGRVDDTITFSGGAQISAMLLERIVRAIPGVARFQFKQTSRDAVQLLVVPDRRFSEESRVLLGRIQDQLSRQAGVSIAIEPVLVDEIAVLPNGKHASLVRLEDQTPR